MTIASISMVEAVAGKNAILDGMTQSLLKKQVDTIHLNELCFDSSNRGGRSAVNESLLLALKKNAAIKEVKISYNFFQRILQNCYTCCCHCPRSCSRSCSRSRRSSHYYCFSNGDDCNKNINNVNENVDDDHDDNCNIDEENQNWLLNNDNEENINNENFLVLGRQPRPLRNSSILNDSSCHSRSHPCLYGNDDDRMRTTTCSGISSHMNNNHHQLDTIFELILDLPNLEHLRIVNNNNNQYDSLLAAAPYQQNDDGEGTIFDVGARTKRRRLIMDQDEWMKHVVSTKFGNALGNAKNTSLTKLRLTNGGAASSGIGSFFGRVGFSTSRNSRSSTSSVLDWNIVQNGIRLNRTLKELDLSWNGLHHHAEHQPSSHHSRHTTTTGTTTTALLNDTTSADNDSRDDNESTTMTPTLWSSPSSSSTSSSFRAVIASVLHKDSNIKTLKLNHNQIRDQDCCIIADCFIDAFIKADIAKATISNDRGNNNANNNNNEFQKKTNNDDHDGSSCSLTSLSLQCNYIGSNGCIALMKSLFLTPSSSSLICHLNLSFNQIGSDACEIIAEVLNSKQKNRSCPLKTLDLSHNMIDDVGCNTLVEHGLRHNSTLKTLDLAYNQISIHQLQQSFGSPNNSGITTANIKKFHVDEEQQQQQVQLQFWDQNMTLKNLDLYQDHPNSYDYHHQFQLIMDHVQFYLKLNRIGRSYLLRREPRYDDDYHNDNDSVKYSSSSFLFEQSSENMMKEQWIMALIRSRKDLSCLFYFLSCDPALVFE